MYGMLVRLVLGPRFESAELVLRNVTEIHYNYPMLSRDGAIRTNRVAFESDIHGTGLVYSISDIVEFETVPETEITEAF